MKIFYFKWKKLKGINNQQMKRRQQIVVCCLLAGFCGVLSGCAPIEKLQQWKTAQTQEANEQQPVAQNQLYLDPSQADLTQNTSVSASGNQLLAPGDTKEVVLYFTDEKGENLVAEKRTISKVEGIARETVNALLQGPQNNDLKASVPPGTVLKDINIKEDGCCVVDFSKELVANHSKEKGAELITVTAIVQTLGQFSSVTEVQILVEGKVISTIAGTVDVSAPIQTRP